MNKAHATSDCLHDTWERIVIHSAVSDKTLTLDVVQTPGMFFFQNADYAVAEMNSVYPQPRASISLCCFFCTQATTMFSMSMQLYPGNLPLLSRFLLTRNKHFPK